MRILVINGGSSSVKCALYEISAAPSLDASPALWEDRFELWDEELESGKSTPVADALAPVASAMAGQVDVVGHRIVHGGSVYRESAMLTPEVRAAIAQQAEMAPAHNRRELEAIELIDRLFGKSARQVAVFDTAFHSTLPPEAYIYPGPYHWLEEGIRRYGFHGISVQYAAGRAAELLGGDPGSLRLIVCHLGNGASITAVRGGKSVDTTMGFTPLEGLMMGSRSGSIDPGILTHLIRRHGYTADQLDRILNRQSGLLGISGISPDMRDILDEIDRRDDRARLAYDIYAHRVVKEGGAMLAVLGGADALVFTGGVGENCGPLRELVAARLQSLLPGLRVLVIHAEEEWEIARECFRVALSNLAG